MLALILGEVPLCSRLFISPKVSSTVLLTIKIPVTMSLYSEVTSRGPPYDRATRMVVIQNFDRRCFP